MHYVTAFSLLARRFARLLHSKLFITFARDDRTKFLLNSASDFTQWARFAHDCSDTICDACEDSEGKLICELSESVIGCSNCLCHARQCSIIDNFQVAAFQWRFGVDRYDAVEYKQQFQDFKRHFVNNRYEWTRMDRLEPGGEGSLSRELLDELTILRMQIELDHAKLNFTASAFRNSLRCIRDQSEDAGFHSIMKAKDAAWAMAEGFIIIRELAEDVLSGDASRHPEAWDAALLPARLLNGCKPSIQERAVDFMSNPAI